MKETKTAVSFAWLVLAFYILYAIFGIGFNGLLFSVAIGFIVFSFNDNMMIVAAATILAGIFWRTVLSARLMDAFADVKVSAGPDGKVAFPESKVAEIVKRVTGEAALQGVGSKFAEGFADAVALDAPRPDAGSGAAEKKDSVETGESKPAGAKEAGVSAAMKESAPNSDAEKAMEADLPKIGVQEKKVPKEEKSGGYHVDAATTLTNALNNLNPKQIEAMTNDTKALLETQKSLMGMLQSMKPLLVDGQEMMTTFQGMFGSQK
jgi:hypothetical protein